MRWMCSGIFILWVATLVRLWTSPALCMLAKNKRPYDAAALPPAARLRNNVRDILGDNLLSTRRVQELTNDISEVRDTRFLRSGKDKRGRKLRNHLKKQRKWPDVYWARIRTKNRRTQREVRTWMAIWLPHELLAKLYDYGIPDALRSTEGMDPLTKEHWAHCCAEAGVDDLIGLGIWGDGCPCNWDRTRSLEVLSMNLPGLTGEFKNLRIPLCGILKEHVGPHTYDDLFDVIKWSLEHLAEGTNPETRHDDLRFERWTGDASRQSGGALPFRAALCEVRGDWKFMSDTFRLPRHNLNGGICWSCNCTPATINNVALGRRERCGCDAAGEACGASSKERPRRPCERLLPPGTRQPPTRIPIKRSGASLLPQYPINTHHPSY